MRGRGLIAFVLLAACRSAPQVETASALSRADYAIRAGRILDPESGGYSAPSVILVERGRIAEILPSNRYNRNLADSTIDLQEFTILPGLIDGHVHLAIGGPPAANALADLRAGFTTIVDLGARTHRLLGIRDSINRGTIPGPRVIAAGIWIGAKGGVCEFNGIGIPGGPDDYRQRVRDNAAAGAEIAKVCLSGWPAAAFAQPDKYELTDEALRATVEEARRANQVVVAHAISAGSVRAALDAGVGGLAHAAYIDSAVATRMRTQGMFMATTLASLTARDTSPASVALRNAVTVANRTGVRIVFGTDGGVLPHGRNAEEFEALMRAGMSPLEAIRAATVSAARAYRLQDSVGSVKRGMVADLIAVGGDPLSDITSLRTPVFVMSRGRGVTLSPR